MRITLLVVLLSASFASAEDKDFPVTSARVHKGNLVPFDGQCIEDKEFVRREGINERNAAELADAQSKVLLPKAAFVAIVIGALAVGAAVTAGVAVAAKR